MRVVAGLAKGRTLSAVPGDQTRPTTDKVKEAIFSMIGPYCEGDIVLDLFAGTGGLGIEAWSRGADRVIFIDREKTSVDVIRKNCATVGATQDCEIYRNDAERALKALVKREMKFSMVFLDPPYRMKSMDQFMQELAAGKLLLEGAIIVIEHDADVHYPETMRLFRQVKAVKYGDIAVTIYHFESEGTTE